MWVSPCPLTPIGPLVHWSIILAHSLVHWSIRWSTHPTAGYGPTTLAVGALFRGEEPERHHMRGVRHGHRGRIGPCGPCKHVVRLVVCSIQHVVRLVVCSMQIRRSFGRVFHSTRRSFGRVLHANTSFVWSCAPCKHVVRLVVCSMQIRCSLGRAVHSTRCLT